MAEGFEITVPDLRRVPLRVRRSAGIRTHFVAPVVRGADVFVVTGNGKHLDRVLSAWNRSLVPQPDRDRTCWAVCTPRRGGGWLPVLSTMSWTRKGAITAFDDAGGRYGRERRKGRAKVMKCSLGIHLQNGDDR